MQKIISKTATSLSHVHLGPDTLKSRARHPVCATLVRCTLQTQETPAPAGIEEPKLDWSRVISLAGCSFEAYGSPGGECMKHRANNGTEMTFIDPAFLRSKASLLRMKLKAAHSLHPKHLPTYPVYPHCVFTIGDTSWTSPTAPTPSLDPEWDGDAGCTMFVLAAAEPILHVQVMDGDMPLGEASLDLTEIEGSQAPTDVVVPLAGDHADDCGTVALSVHLHRFTDLGAQKATCSCDIDEHVLGAPGQGLMSQEWRQLYEDYVGDGAPTLQPVCFIENMETHTQAWAFWNPEQRQLCIAFRGTEKDAWRDALTNITLTSVSLSREKVQNTDVSLTAPLPTEPSNEEVEVKEHLEPQEGQELSTSMLNAATAMLNEMKVVYNFSAKGEAEKNEAWVHKGFLTAYDSVRPQVLSLIDTVLAGEEAPEKWEILLTGHSLGGALATLAAYDVALQRKGPKIVMVNFGSPRVGNTQFAAEFNRSVPNAWRIVNNNDAVCTVPRLMGYCHVGHAATVKPCGDVDLVHDSSCHGFEGTSLEKVVPAVGAATVAAIASAVPAVISKEEEVLKSNDQDQDQEEKEEGGEFTSGQLAQLWEEEKEAWSLLLDGQAVEEHMEDSGYYIALKGVVDKLKCPVTK